jgi:prepilin signal peptidase PulO-like enzyme (type II secretory pathway)
MKKQIVSISILQSSKIATILYFLLGLIYLLIGVPTIIFGNNQIRIMGIIYCAMPILMAVIGFIGFVIFAALYNLIAKWVGGMEFEMIDVPEEQDTAGNQVGEVI